MYSQKLADRNHLMKTNYLKYIANVKAIGMLSSLTINTHKRFCPIVTELA